MNKFLSIVGIVLAIIAAGEYFYFTQQLKQWSGLEYQWQDTVKAAQEETKKVQQALKECQERPDASELIKQVTNCRKSCPQAFMNLTEEPTPMPLSEYESWPEFLRPDSQGVVQVVKKYIINNVVDLNSLTILSYGKPLYDNAGHWLMDVAIRARSNDGKYRLHTLYFSFLKDGKIQSVDDTPGSVIE